MNECLYCRKQPVVGDEVACAECLVVVKVVRETIEGMNRAIAEHNKKAVLEVVSKPLDEGK